MTYTCPQCGAVSDHEMDCSTCNVPMIASAPAEASAQPEQAVEGTQEPVVAAGAPESAEPSMEESA